MAKILIVYSTTDGHTLTICNRLKQDIERNGHAVTVLSVADCPGEELRAADKVVVGASIRYGRHSPPLVDFVGRHHSLLASRPNAFFSVSIVARKPEKNTPDTNPYLHKFLRQIAWRPAHLAVFAGKLGYPRYGFFDRQMIRLIMLITRGPTDPATVVDFTDWNKVADFAQLVSEI